MMETEEKLKEDIIKEIIIKIETKVSEGKILAHFKSDLESEGWIDKIKSIEVKGKADNVRFENEDKK